jgi:hypothetical protein
MAHLGCFVRAGGPSDMLLRKDWWPIWHVCKVGGPSGVWALRLVAHVARGVLSGTAYLRHCEARAYTDSWTPSHSAHAPFEVVHGLHQRVHRAPWREVAWQPWASPHPAHCQWSQVHRLQKRGEHGASPGGKGGIEGAGGGGGGGVGCGGGGGAGMPVHSLSFWTVAVILVPSLPHHAGTHVHMWDAARAGASSRASSCESVRDETRWRRLHGV